ncbi:MAG: TrkA family potassium uptake protein [Selenomonadaceae bacterium]|nr:TrkA family potassium uptake protein [Selenomonadaceae bacterium]
MADKKQFAVLGLGRFGKNVALTLENMGYEVLGVDRDENVAAELAESLTHVVSFDFRDAHTLDQIGIANFDTVVIASKVLEASLMATMLCSERNVPEIVVKAIDERHAEMAKRLGATKIIFSERDTARRVAAHLVSSNVVDYIELDAELKILKLDVPPKFIGKNLIELNLRAAYDVNIIALISGGKTLVPPPPQHVFATGDEIFVIGTNVALSNFERNI